MAQARHKQVLRTGKHVRRRRVIRLGVPASAAALALASPAAGVVWPDAQPVRDVTLFRAAPAAPHPHVSVRPSPVPMRVAPITRAQQTVSFVEKSPEVTDHKFTTAALNIRPRPSGDAPVLDVLGLAEKVGVTGERRGRWVQVVVGNRVVWVHGAYLADTKPTPSPSPATEPSQAPSPSPVPTPMPTPTPTPATTVLSTAPCPNGSEVESGLVQDAVDVHRAVCAAFPQVTSYGGVRPGDPGEHGTGHALDIMIPDASTGDQIAAWVRSHASELHVDYVIWNQHIWSVARSSEGWRPMADRGSATANHEDHVHVTVN